VLASWALTLSVFSSRTLCWHLELSHYQSSAAEPCVPSWAVTISSSLEPCAGILSSYSISLKQQNPVLASWALTVSVFSSRTLCCILSSYSISLQLLVCYIIFRGVQNQNFITKNWWISFAMHVNLAHIHCPFTKFSWARTTQSVKQVTGSVPVGGKYIFIHHPGLYVVGLRVAMAWSL
jgi:hypothetical protein